MIAHIGHWYHSLLYLGPLVILSVLAFVTAARSTGEASEQA